MATTGILSPAEIAYIEKLPARVTQLKRLFLLVSLVLLGFVAASLHSALQLGNEHGITGLREILRVFLQFDPKPDHSYTGWEICLVHKMGGAFVGLLLQLLNWSCFQGWWRCREGLIKLHNDPAEAAKAPALISLAHCRTLEYFNRNKYFLLIGDFFLLAAAAMQYQMVIKIAALLGIKTIQELMTFYLGLNFQPEQIYFGWQIILHQATSKLLLLSALALLLIPALYLNYRFNHYPNSLILKILTSREPDPATR